MTADNRTLAIAERVSAVTYADLDKQTVATVKRLIADGVAGDCGQRARGATHTC